MRSSSKNGTLKRILKYVGRYPLSLVGSLLFALVTVVTTLFVPVLFGDAIDCIVENGILWAELKRIFFKVVIAVLVAALAQWLTSICNNRISCNVVRDIRKDAFYKLSKLPLSYIDTHSHGDTVSRVIADADQFSDGLLMGFTQFFTGALTILGTIVFMLITNWKIGLIVVFVTPASLFVAKFVSEHTHKFFRSQTETRGEQTAFTEEMIGGHGCKRVDTDGILNELNDLIFVTLCISCGNTLKGNGSALYDGSKIGLGFSPMVTKDLHNERT